MEDYELLEWHECWMGGKNIVLKIRDYELHKWSECELRGYLCGGISVITPLPWGRGRGRGQLLSVVSVQVDYLLTLLSLYWVAFFILS